MIDNKLIQKTLSELGYDPGPIDGIIGRRTTAAIAKFQKDSKLDIKWPGTVGPKTIEALFGKKKQDVNSLVGKPWFDMALTKKGLHEERDVDELKKFLRADGKALGDPRQFPWCGDFVQTCVALTLPGEIIPINPYLARNWTKFGQPVERTLGAVLVFYRGSRNGIQGHVGFYAGESTNGKNVYVLGGNQSNQISVVPLGVNRLLEARWPLTAPLPKTLEQPKMIGGRLSINEE